MENLKIKIDSKDECAEAQELFFELGYKWHAHVKAVSHLDSFFKGEFTHLVAWSTGCFTNVIQMGCGSEDAKEVTLPQLRDMVILHRNDPEDATHRDHTGYPLFLSSDGVLYYHDGTWLESKAITINPDYLDLIKPIEPVFKEFIVKTDNGYILQMLDERAGGDGVIAVPDNADRARDYGDMGIRFFKGEYTHHQNGEAVFGKIVWERKKSLNDIAKTAEIHRQCNRKTFNDDITFSLGVDLSENPLPFDIDSIDPADHRAELINDLIGLCAEFGYPPNNMMRSRMKWLREQLEIARDADVKDYSGAVVKMMSREEARERLALMFRGESVEINGNLIEFNLVGNFVTQGYRGKSIKGLLSHLFG